jgi:hypothetical protein
MIWMNLAYQRVIALKALLNMLPNNIDVLAVT